MKKFETIIILRPDIAEEEREKIVNEIKDIVTVTNIEEWGKRKLAYPVKKHNEGYYILFEFEKELNEHSKLDSYYANNEAIIKHIIVLKN